MAAVPGTPPSSASAQSGRWAGLVGPFVLHTAMVYVCARIGFPWLFSRWFAWAEPYVHFPGSLLGWSWYLPHLAVVNLALAVAVGYGMGRGLRAAAFGAWAVPALALGVKMWLFAHPPASSVLFQGPPKMTALEYFFGAVSEVPPNAGPMGVFPFDVDYERIFAQMRFTAPFCAGVGYALGALVARYEILTKMFVFEKPLEDEGAPASSNADAVGR
ncbi:MAG TPA: hypothetical protein VLL05_14175 [Terriglobales bacterium]|nr:hypothetical protein [Terriglobales bacterium]